MTWIEVDSLEDQSEVQTRTRDILQGALRGAGLHRLARHVLRAARAHPDPVDQPPGGRVGNGPPLPAPHRAGIEPLLVILSVWGLHTPVRKSESEPARPVAAAV